MVYSLSVVTRVLKMGPRGWRITEGMGIGFVLCVLLTVVVNYSVAVGCGGACFPEKDTPVSFPDHMFVSTTLEKSPTKYIGIAGFSAAAVFGYFMNFGRTLQVGGLAEHLGGNERTILLMHNSVASFFVTLFPISLATWSALAPNDGQTRRMSTHYLYGFFTLASFFTFLYLQIYKIEHLLMTTSAPDGPHLEDGIAQSQAHDRSSKRLESCLFKKLCLKEMVAVAVGFMIMTYAWTRTEEGSALSAGTAVVALALELLLILSISCFVALTDFLTIEKQYTCLQNPQSEMTSTTGNALETVA